MINYRKSALINMCGIKSGRIEFVLQVYGRWPRDLMTIPNKTIHSIAQRFPDHVASPFLIEDGPPPIASKPVRRVEVQNIEGLF